MEHFNTITQFLRITDGFTMGDLLSWLLAALAGYIGYRAIDHMQTSIERHNMVSNIEDGFSHLFDSLVAMRIQNGEDRKIPNPEEDRVMIRNVLHDFTDWELNPKTKEVPQVDSETGELSKVSPEVIILANQRYLHIRDNDYTNEKTGEIVHYDEWISTQALHELTLKARRIEKMFKGRVMRRVDLSDMFRELVPLATSGRLQFIANYYDKYDADCVGYLVMQTIVSCDKYHNEDIVKYFVGYYKEHPEIHKYFTEGVRIRKVYDFHAIRRFNYIVNKYSDK